MGHFFIIFFLLSTGTFIQFRHFMQPRTSWVFFSSVSQNCTSKTVNEHFNFRNIVNVIYTAGSVLVTPSEFLSLKTQILLYSLYHVTHCQCPANRKSKVGFKPDVKLIHHLQQKHTEIKKLKILLSPAKIFSVSHTHTRGSGNGQFI